MTSGTSGWDRVGQEFRKVRHEATRTVIEDSYFVPPEVERLILANVPQAIDELFDDADRRAARAEARVEAAERLNGELAGALERLLAFVGYACDYRDGTNTDPATCPGDPPYAEGPCATCEAGLALTRIKSASADNCPGHGLTQVWCDWCGDLPRTTDVERGSLNHGR